MTRIGKSLALVTVSLLGAAQSPTPPIQPVPLAYWVLPSWKRVLPATVPTQDATAHLFAARGEYQAFQVAIQAPDDGVTLLGSSISNLTDSAGNAVDCAQVTLYREHYVEVDTTSFNWLAKNRSLGPGWYPDALIPVLAEPPTGNPPYRAIPFRVNGAAKTAIWVDVQVQRNAAPGDYTGTITLQTDQGDLVVPWTLTIWNFALPLKPSLHSSFLYWDADSLAAEQELLRHGLSPLKSAPEDQVGLMRDYGLNSAGLPFWGGADASTCKMSQAPPVAQFQAAAAARQTGLYLYDYSADEIGNCVNLFPTVQQWARNMHRAGVRNLVTIPPRPELYDDGSGTGRSAVDIWVVLPMQYDRERARIAEVLAKGDEVWSYNALTQDSYSPKWLIDYDSIGLRLQAGFLSQTMGLTGLLYWRVDLWSSVRRGKAIGLCPEFSGAIRDHLGGLC